MTHPYLRHPARPRVLAHRGLVTPEAAAHGVVDNSFAAIAAAHAAGATYVESDCRVTADDVVVLCHDESLERIAGDRRPVADVSLRELETLLAGHGGVATLEQVLEAFPGVHFNLDVKVAAATIPVAHLAARFPDRILITSFSDARRRAALDAASPALPATSPGSRTIALLLLAVTFRLGRLTARLLHDIDALQIPERQGSFPVLSRRLIDAAHRNGVEVHVWTVNDTARMAELVESGVDGIVTDRADAALAAFGRLRDTPE